MLALLAEGLDNLVIAERLFISLDIARAHVVRVPAKLNIESRLPSSSPSGMPSICRAAD